MQTVSVDEMLGSVGADSWTARWLADWLSLESSPPDLQVTYAWYWCQGPEAHLDVAGSIWGWQLSRTWWLLALSGPNGPTHWTLQSSDPKTGVPDSWAYLDSLSLSRPVPQAELILL